MLNSFIYSTAAITITVDDELAVGETINFVQNTADAITFAAGAGVTLNSKDAALLTGGQFAGASITKKATNSYYLVGVSSMSLIPFGFLGCFWCRRWRCFPMTY